MKKVWKYGSFVAGLLLVPLSVRAAVPVTVDLVNAAQPVSEVGVGNNAAGDGQWFVTLGSPSTSGGNTVDTLSGDFTGTTTGFTGGTYSLLTTYVGDIASPVEIVGISPGSDIISLESIPSTATINLDLTPTGGSEVTEKILANSTFFAGAGFHFFFNSYATTVIPATDVEVGATAGATGSGPIHGDAEFDIPSIVTPPPPPPPPPSTVPLPTSAVMASVLLAGLAGFQVLSRKMKTA
jgi:hypothetical protein